MAHLFRLELKKFKLVKQIVFSLIAIIFSILFITVSLTDSMTDPAQTKDTFDSTFLLIELLMSLIFLVYSSVLISSLVISEYNQRTITILFSYSSAEAFIEPSCGCESDESKIHRRTHRWKWSANIIPVIQNKAMKQSIHWLSFSYPKIK